jgi:hypothetical protein
VANVTLHPGRAHVDDPKVTAEETVTVRVGPVDVGPARAWIAHEQRNLAILRANVEKLPFHVPAEVIDLIGAYFDEWEPIASGAGPFEWTATMDRHQLELVVRYWANLDLMTDELVERVGVEWAPLSTRSFFDAVVAAVDVALRHDDGSPDPFARILAR